MTLLDEPHLGMDAPSRQLFYDELFREAVRTPRTFLLSSHLIAEIQPLIERTIVLDHGKLLMCDDVDTLRANGFSLTGPREAVEKLSADMNVINSRDLGPTRQVAILQPHTRELAARVRENGCHIGVLGLQELIIAVTASHTRRAS